MTSRILAVVVVGGFVAGLAAETRAQQGTTSTRKPRQAKSTSALRTPAASGVESDSVSPGTAGGRDPFDSATDKLKGSEKPGSGSKSPGESADDSEKDAPAQLQKATFGGGCFWHVEAAFEWLPGVKSAVSGYSGGSVPDPDYELVHSGMSGHAEVVQVTYDPTVISYEQLLKVFWSHHDPTQLNRQGPDFGTQYRSVIFYHTPAQREAALKSYRALTAARAFRGPIVTQLLPMRTFYRAEDYHQNYYGGKPDAPIARPRTTSRAKRLRKPDTKTMTAKPATRSTARSSASSKGAKVSPPVTTSTAGAKDTDPVKPEPQ
jgi:peptide-methionine (S)-S-oxide reductase